MERAERESRELTINDLMPHPLFLVSLDYLQKHSHKSTVPQLCHLNQNSQNDYSCWVFLDQSGVFQNVGLVSVGVEVFVR